MRKLWAPLFVVLAGLLSGCDNFALFVSAPIPDTGLPPAAPPPRSIVLGDVVHGTFIVPEICFDVQAPRSGTLFIRITWDRRHGDLDLAFLSTVMSTTSHDALVTGSLHVAQGQRYRITVVGDHGPVPFSLTTSIQ
ncbi:MAG TPA: hypothetical protein VFO21_24695 [Vicinamibacterales bacterium]|nr:hypothetical protein [Vicinamibacterales bacterium]